MLLIYQNYQNLAAIKALFVVSSFLSSVCYVIVQEFIDSLLDECAKVGISEIGNNVPETAWHGGGQNTVEDTLRTAVQYGQETFGQKPRIIFILLPGNGKPCVGHVLLLTMHYQKQTRSSI